MRYYRPCVYLRVQVCSLIWLHCAFLASPPAFGWSNYIPNAFHTSCILNCQDRSLKNRFYFIGLLSLGFVTPVVIISACYLIIFASVLAHRRQMVHLLANTRLIFSKQNWPMIIDIKRAQIMIILIAFYLTSWTPYAVISAISLFGPAGLTNPLFLSLASHIAKAAVVWNPIIYGFLHPQFRKTLQNCMVGQIPPGTTISGTTKMEHHEPKIQLHSLGPEVGLRRQRGSSSVKRRLPIFRRSFWYLLKYLPKFSSLKIWLELDATCEIIIKDVWYFLPAPCIKLDFWISVYLCGKRKKKYNRKFFCSLLVILLLHVVMVKCLFVCPSPWVKTLLIKFCKRLNLLRYNTSAERCQLEYENPNIVRR